MSSLEGKVALVTGASRGLSFEAVYCASKFAHVGFTRARPMTETSWG
jgi:NAD(P)-dependent dehydrogenase (short-subunit alcohol dehydrogenase family)